MKTKITQKLFNGKAVILTPIFATLFVIQGYTCENCSRAESLKMGMQKLWSDHVVWTRNVIICFVDDTPGKSEAVARLLKNQEDIGYAIKPYYGDGGGDALTKLLKEHIVGAAEILTAAKSGNSDEMNAVVAKWYVNGDEIATFLNKANPKNWKLDDMKKMMKGHLDITIAEATARLKKDYAADVVAFDKAHEEILMMADGLTAGIQAQFPQMFKKKK